MRWVRCKRCGRLIKIWSEYDIYDMMEEFGEILCPSCQREAYENE